MNKLSNKTLFELEPELEKELHRFKKEIYAEGFDCYCEEVNNG